MRNLAISFYLLFCLCCASGAMPEKAPCLSYGSIVSDNAYATLEYGDGKVEGYVFFPNKLFKHTSFPIQMRCLYFRTPSSPPFFTIKYNLYTPFLMFKKYTSSCTIQVSFDIYKGFLFNTISSDPAHLQCQWDAKKKTLIIHQNK